MAHAGHDAIDTIAAVVFLIGGAIFTALAYRTRPARLGPAASVDHRSAWGSDAATHAAPDRSLVAIMAGLSAGAAVIHLVAAPTHYRELGDLGAGFLVAAAFQAWWAQRCLTAREGPSRTLVAVGVLGNVAIVAAWAWTRSVGLPIGPFAGTAEPIGFPDGACAAFEILLVGLLAARGIRGVGRLVGHLDLRAVAPIAVVPTLGLVLVLTSLATLAIATGLDHGAPAGVSVGQTHSPTH